MDRESLGCKLRELRFVSTKQSHPIAPQFCTSLTQLSLEIVQHFRRNQEFGVLRPTIASFGAANLLFPEWFAVGSARILLVRRTVGDMAIDDDQTRSVRRLLETLKRFSQEIQIVGV